MYRYFFEMLRRVLTLFASFICAQNVSGLNPTYQCNNCQVSTLCQQQNFITETFQTAEECRELCLETANQCQMADYEMKSGTCKIYTCTQVIQTYGYIAFRRSINPVCSPYTLARYEEYKGTGACLLEATTVPRDLIECINYCLERAGCIAVDMSGSLCTLHSCGERVAASQTTFVERICQQEKKYIQTCLNCNEGSQCGTYYASESKIDCDQRCVSDKNCSLAVVYYNGCRMFGCSFLQTSSMTAYRKSPIDDCLVFETASIAGHVGTCPIIEIRYNFPNQDYCFDICLDTPGCRAVTYALSPDTCTLHGCNFKEQQDVGSHLFIERKCIVTSTAVTTVLDTTPNKMTSELTSTTTTSRALTTVTKTSSTATTTLTTAPPTETTTSLIKASTTAPTHLTSLSSAVTSSVSSTAKFATTTTDVFTTKSKATHTSITMRCSGVLTAHKSYIDFLVLISSLLFWAVHLSL